MQYSPFIAFCQLFSPEAFCDTLLAGQIWLLLPLKQCGDRWVYVHVEVQASRDADFKRRMFTYNYRIFDRYDRSVGSFAVLGDEAPKWRPEKFGYEVLGCRMQLDFPVVKLLDYEGDLESLLDQENVFALVTAAHLMTKKTRGDENDRLDAKFRLTRLLFERNWDRQRIIDLASCRIGWR